MAIGNPASSAIAGLVMECLVGYVLRAVDAHVLFFYLYVDDSICVVPKISEEIVLQAFKKYDNRIKFTLEKERKSEIAFLDIKVGRVKDAIVYIHVGRQK